MHVCLGAPGLSRNDPLRFAAALLDTMLGASASSRLFQEIRERRGMAYSVYSYGSHYAETGQVGIYLGTRAENLVECMRVVREQIGELAAGRFGDEELERARENLKGRVLLSMELTSARMSRLGRSVLAGTEIQSLDRIAAEIDAVEREHVADLADRLFAPERLSAAGIGADAGLYDEALREISEPIQGAA